MKGQILKYKVAFYILSSVYLVRPGNNVPGDVRPFNDIVDTGHLFAYPT